MAELTHFNAAGEAHMVDIAGKAVTDRSATAKVLVRMAAVTRDLIGSGSAKKGDVLGTARLAGIMAAKRTSDLIPLCHPLALSSVSLTLDLVPEGVEIAATVATTGRTGVEMEALTAASVAALTVYDMTKALDKGIVIRSIQLESKTGGKSGDYARQPATNQPGN